VGGLEFRFDLILDGLEKLRDTAAQVGVSERAIMAQTGHRSVTMIRKYICDGSLVRDNAQIVRSYAGSVAPVAHSAMPTLPAPPPAPRR
jgi:hypothetical protein